MNGGWGEAGQRVRERRETEKVWYDGNEGYDGMGMKGMMVWKRRVRQYGTEG